MGSKAVFISKGYDYFYSREYLIKEVRIENEEDEKKDILTLSRKLGKVLKTSLNYNDLKEELEKKGFVKEKSVFENTRLHTEKWCFDKK